MKPVTVRFFAVFREAVGVEAVELNTQSNTLQELFTEMTVLYPSLNHEAAALVAVNDEMVDWGCTIASGDEVLFFPPVAGG